MLAIVLAATLQQAATGQVVWETPLPSPPVEAVAPDDIPAIPDYARADPFGYERAECSPLVRKVEESMDACQQRVRVALAVNLGPALPAGLAPAAAAENCRPEAEGDRYALQCGAPTRSAPPAPDLRVRSCTTRPSVTEGGAVSFVETCTVGGEDVRDEGLRVRLGGRD
jgi:hypothetical protein